jgi:NAD(P)H-hydrate epimerase
MRKAISAEEALRIDQVAMREYGIPSLLLMENAGRSVSDVISREYKPGSVLVFAGKGNNGGDGLVTARHLANRGFAVRVVLLEDPAKLKADPLIHYEIVKRMNVPLEQVSREVTEDALRGYCDMADVLVDAIFGVGLRRPMQGIFEKAIRAINRSQRPVVSIDIPSGLDADYGQVRGVAVKAARSVTLSLPKLGLYKGEGPQYAGEIEVVDIGIPRELLLPYLNA